MEEENWEVVNKKKKPTKPKPPRDGWSATSLPKPRCPRLATSSPDPKHNANTIVVNGMRLRRIKTQDYTLTPDEEQLVISALGPMYCCSCCLVGAIRDVINRPFCGCHKCYCCVGDDPAFDDPRTQTYVNESLTYVYTRWI